MSKLPFTEEQLEIMLNRAARKGAKQALEDIGIESADAAHDVKELRSLLSSYRMAKNTMWQTIIRILTAGFLIALMTGISLKLKLFGGQ